MFCGKCIYPVTKKFRFYNLSHDTAHHRNKKEKELNNNDAPAGNLASSTGDIAKVDESDSGNLSFTGVWLSHVAYDAILLMKLLSPFQYLMIQRLKGMM